MMSNWGPEDDPKPTINWSCLAVIGFSLLFWAVVVFVCTWMIR